MKHATRGILLGMVLAMVACGGEVGAADGAPTDVTPDDGMNTAGGGALPPDLGDPIDAPGDTPSDPGPNPNDPSNPNDPGQDPSGPMQMAPSGQARFDLGELPDGFSINWPVEPETASMVAASSARQVDQAAAQGRVTIELSGDVGDLALQATDVHIIADDATVGTLMIERGSARVHVEGGRFTSIQVQPPESESDMVHDVLIERAHIEGGRMAVAFRGARLAVIDSILRASQYAVFGSHLDAPYGSDIIIARNEGTSETGAEATVRLTGFDRTATIDNVLRNPIKHNYRIHGTSRNNLARGNTLIQTGSMIGTMPPDDVGPQWVIDNVFYHSSNSLLQVEPGRVESLVATGNVAYSERRCFVCSEGSGWNVDGNQINPYQDPPGDL